MDGPLGYFLTWTCHGTWLHGDERGSVHRTCNTPGSDYLPPNSAWRDWERLETKPHAVLLTPEMRLLVEQTIDAHASYRKWTLHARNARSNHVHVVVASDREPDRTMDELKAWCTRRLRERGYFAANVKVWTEGGSRRQLWNEGSLCAAIRYVEDGQGPERFRG